MRKEVAEAKIKKVVESYEKNLSTNISWIDIERTKLQGFLGKSETKIVIKHGE